MSAAAEKLVAAEAPDDRQKQVWRADVATGLHGPAAAQRIFDARNAPSANVTPYEAVLPPLLRAVGWGGEPRHVVEALPHFDHVANLVDLRVVLHHLGLRTAVREARVATQSDSDFPCLIIIGGAPTLALRRVRPGVLLTEDGEGAARETSEPAQPVQILRALDPEVDPEEASADGARGSWFWSAAAYLAPSFRGVLALTLVINVLALTTPLFSMAIYNNVARSGLTETLIAAVGLAIAAILLEAHLRGLRGELLATTAARLNSHTQRAAFGRILTLPASMTETASISMQSARLKQFEAIIGAFTSPLAVSAFDLPFTVLFLVAIALIGGPLVWIPIVLIIVFVVSAAFLAPSARRQNAEAASSRLNAQDLIRQTVRGAATIRGLGVEREWLDKVRPTLVASGKSRLRLQLQDAMVRGGAQLLTSLSAIMVMAVGATLVMGDALSMGALIAVMMIVWRVLSPIQTVFLSINQIASTRDAIRQIDNLMRLTPERDLARPPTIYRRFDGAVRVENMSFRYPRASDAVWRGLSFDAAPGEIVGFLGSSGVGKTTLFKILLKMYEPSAGQVFFDDLNLAQLEPGEVRAAVGYAPERPEFFFGTLAQNMRLAHRTATNDEIEQALALVGLELGGAALPDGARTRLTSERLAAISDSDLQRISLARALVKPAPHLFLDDPTTHLDNEAKDRMLAALRARAGGQTVLMITNDALALSICDRVVVAGRGRILRGGAPDQVLPDSRHLLTNSEL